MAALLVVAACGGAAAPVAQPAEPSAAAPTESVAAPTEPVAGISEPEQPTTEEAAVPTQPADSSIDPTEHPIVLAATATGAAAGAWRVAVTLSSEYDSPQRYADAWRVLDADDTELGIRVLLHDHANEQPFTRSGTIEIPEGLTTVFIEGRDQQYGWSGQRFELVLPVP